LGVGPGQILIGQGLYEKETRIGVRTALEQLLAIQELR
jgi:hypothetical protein